MTPFPVILASTSPYRRKLLERLGLPFETLPPATDETPLPNESVTALTARLAQDKAHSLARQHPNALVIGSDQSAAIDDTLLSKPGNHSNAFAQLRRCSGRRVTFYTAFALVRQQPHFQAVHIEPFTVHFRRLSDTEIDNYLHREQPWDCAGSFKCEGLGIALFEKMEGNDPTALEGLPLIALTHALQQAGCPVI